MNQEQKEQLERCLKICENNLKKAIELIEDKRTNFMLVCKLNGIYEETVSALNTIEV